MAMKWVCVVTAPNEPIGESWVEVLKQRGIPAYLNMDVVRSYLGIGVAPVRIMVPEEREAEGKRLLDEMIGPDEWPPEPDR